MSGNALRCLVCGAYHTSNLSVLSVKDAGTYRPSWLFTNLWKKEKQKEIEKKEEEATFKLCEDLKVI